MRHPRYFCRFLAVGERWDTPTFGWIRRTKTYLQVRFGPLGKCGSRKAQKGKAERHAVKALLQPSFMLPVAIRAVLTSQKTLASFLRNGQLHFFLGLLHNKEVTLKVKLRAISPIFFPFLILGQLAFSQSNTGRIDGTVQDATSAVVVGAKVTAMETKTQATTRTVSGPSGNFTFPSLQPGFYTLNVDAVGFRKEVLKDIELPVGQTISENVKLQVGSSGDSVTVDASTPSVQTTDSQIGTAITMKEVENLPNVARTPITLALLQPGVEIDVRAGQDASFSHINGQRQGSNNTTLDGIDANDSVAPRLGLSLTANNTDSVEQVSVLTSGFNPEFGRSAGSEIQLVTRSGTNVYHGNAFDYLRNTDLNANDWFNNQIGNTIPQFIRNSYGGSFGGPIKKNKTFIFGNFQGTRTHQQTTHERQVPTLTARQGIFQWGGLFGCRPPVQHRRE